MACPEGIQTCNMKNRDIYWRRYKIQKSLYIGQWHHSSLQSRLLGDLTQFSLLPSATPLYFPEPHRWSDISSLSKVILVLVKARSHSVPNVGCRGTESHGWFDVSPKNSARDNEVWAGALLWWSYQSLLVAHSCGRLNHLNSFCGGMFKLNTQPFWMWWPQSTHIHSSAPTAPIY